MARFYIPSSGPVGPPPADPILVRGAISRQTSGTVNITTAGVYVPMGLSGTLQTGETLRNMMAADNNFPTDVSGLKNTGDTKTLAVIATYDGKAGNNQAIGLKLAVNGVPFDMTECTSFGGPSGQFAKTMTQWIFQVGNGDEITMWVANKDGTTNLDIARYKMIAYAI
jgi:hypothetical protein